MDYEEDNSDNTNTLFLIEPIFGRIGGHIGNHEVYKCPSDRSWAEIGGETHPRVRSYSMNGFVGARRHSGGAYWRLFLKTTDFRHPAPVNTWVFIDEHEDTIDDGRFSVDHDDPWWVDLAASRHGGSGTLSFADGHAEIKRWVDPRTRKPVERKKVFGFPSPNNPDLLWLKERTTSIVGEL
ncbi:MAG TPA: hypothetical protein VMS21_01020 [Methylomirabilota bacterium]|nr:hypothetical protein [Methylomirabilota bacterium]